VTLIFFLEYTLEGVLIIYKKYQDGRYNAKKATTPRTQHDTSSSDKQHTLYKPDDKWPTLLNI
jgi:malate synthase